MLFKIFYVSDFRVKLEHRYR